MLGLFKKIFGTQNERALKKLEGTVEEINALEEKFSAFSDDEIKAEYGRIKKEVLDEYEKTASERERVKERIGTASTETERNKYKKELRSIKNGVLAGKIAEVFAIVREVSKRTIGLRHFDVQLQGGMVLHEGKIAEMATGEGKTLVATLAVCLNACLDESIHVITVNDYLAKRDSEWMGPIYKFLGLIVGIVQNDMRPVERKKAYAADVVYGTNNEFGFDYLRDNMVSDVEEMVQKPLSFAIIDEVDSILVDEARTPLIISGPVNETNEAYNQMRPVVQEIVKNQKRLIGEYLTLFRKKLSENEKESAGEVLYLIHKSDPKNREFLDIILKDYAAKALFDKAQSLLDGKVMEKERHELLEELYYVFDEKSREATFSAKGQKMMQEKFGIEFILEDIEAMLAELADKDMPEEEKVAEETKLVSAYAQQQKKVDGIKQLLKAYILFQKDVDYVIKDNKIVIVDGFTGRMMPGRRFSDGIHEAIEAKERVEVQRESQTLATITLQNYFRMYDKLSGMTGTAKTEEAEFENIYLLPVIQMPTNRPLARTSMPDRIYKTEREKFNAVIEEIVSLNKKGSPVLVGTISIEKSEKLSKKLAQRGVKHNVLNAKYHEREAHIIAQAGQFRAVTIATNMAGRGTDIMLGGSAEHLAEEAVEKLEIDDPVERDKARGNFLIEAKKEILLGREKVLAAGGLHVIGTERHEARRIDNQLSGRSGRQGDPGANRFYLSLEDDLMRIFGSDRIKGIMDRLGMEDGEVIENPLVTRAISTAQRRVEGQNFEVRKHLLKYDNVMSQQREVIYRRRRMVLMMEELKNEFFECLCVGLESVLESAEDELPDLEKIAKQVMYKYALNIKQLVSERMTAKEIMDLVVEKAKTSYAAREKFIGKERLGEIEKMVMISVIDSNWKDYLREVDDLREGISWRAYAQKDPLIEFQHEAFKMFTELIIKVDEEIAERIMKISAMEEQYQKSVFEPGNEILEHKEYSAIGESSSGQDEVYGKGMDTLTTASGNTMPEGVRAGYPRSRVKPGMTREGARMTGDHGQSGKKVGRNEPCPCGSGKKYKKCCGK